VTTWRTIPGYPLYEMSDDAVVRRAVKTTSGTSGHIITQRFSSSGERFVQLRKAQVGRRNDTCLVSDLHAATFPPREESFAPIPALAEQYVATRDTIIRIHPLKGFRKEVDIFPQADGRIDVALKVFRK